MENICSLKLLSETLLFGHDEHRKCICSRETFEAYFCDRGWVTSTIDLTSLFTTLY